MHATDGAGLTQLTNLSVQNAEPAWSPDGSRIAFVSWNTGTQQIYEINPDGTGLTRISNNTSNDSRPSWNPASDRIAFISDRNGASWTSTS